jgi:uncharacterized membrane protein YcfT
MYDYRAIRLITSANTVPQRVDWVDYAKGICIILVVMMHSTLGVEKAFGIAEHSSRMGEFIAWARPFRMPDFFLISGLFLARRIAAPWPRYLDSKVVHFLYFYLLWMTIQFITKGHGIMQAQGAAGLAREYALAFIEPFGTLWFIYLLAIFFVIVKLCRGVPHVLMLVAGVLLEISDIHTGWILIDEAASRFIYFYIGYLFAPQIFRFAEIVSQWRLLPILAALGAWAFVNAMLVFSGYAVLPFISLVLGLAGALAVITFAVLFARINWANGLRFLGQNSIVVYLAFFLFMAATRAVLLRVAPWLGPDLISILVTAAGVAGPVILNLLVKNSPARMLFVRPSWARVESWLPGWHSARHDISQKFGEA